MKFTGTKDYVATDDLKVAVNAAIVLERPLLVKGEPGTGKTVLAEEVAKAIDAPLLTWHIKSTTKAQQGLYEYDAVSRLRDSQLGDARVSDIKNYIKRGKLWEAFTHEKRPVLLIDEIDKADIEFPNDLLTELDRMEFHVYETGETVRARRRPVVIITSNNEKELPDAFLRRCFFHYIRFPDADTMRAIVEVHTDDGLLGLGENEYWMFFVPMVVCMIAGSWLSARAAGHLSAARQASYGLLFALASATVGVVIALQPWGSDVPWALVAPSLTAFGVAVALPVLQLAQLDEFPQARGTAA
ncbi:AAA family ATPase, partial [uncultured Bradyrhizobium sp.]